MISGWVQKVTRHNGIIRYPLRQKIENVSRCFKLFCMAGITADNKYDTAHGRFYFWGGAKSLIGRF